jgi:DNA-binding NarL/FixJ family response regulator
VSPIRLLLVEDHTIVRQGLRALLGSNLEIVGEAADGAEGVRLALELKPDVVVMDLSLPGLHGTEAIRRIKDKLPDTRVIVLSMHSSHEIVARAREAGCDGYVVKGGDVSELNSAIQSALAGKPYFSKDVRSREGDAAQAASDPLSRLSTREREVLKLIAEGNTNKGIAKLLSISVHTVNAHRVNLMAKLDLHDAQGLTRFALRHGLITTDGSH